jgi:hypothetical protein
VPLAAAALIGCGAPTQMLAAPADLADYRAFRTAAYEGDRLAKGQAYLESHPDGAWAGEVREAFETEEAAWFERSKSSRFLARAYLASLPRGPHAEAARALMVLFDEHEGDIETLELLADARRTSATLDEAAAKRRRVGEVVLEELAALLDTATWGARLDALPPTLAQALRGPVRRTWGGGVRAWREDRLFFVVPTPQGASSRVADVRLQLWLDSGRIAQGTIEGADLFVRWAEAIEMRPLDPDRPADRAAALSTVTEVLSGAVESSLPAARCAQAPSRNAPAESIVLARACDGWELVARVAERDGDPDSIEVRGPQPPR